MSPEDKKWAEEKETCRQIVTTINNFGVNQKQLLFLIYLLSLELEDLEQMRELTALVHELGGANLFLSLRE